MHDNILAVVVSELGTTAAETFSGDGIQNLGIYLLDLCQGGVVWEIRSIRTIWQFTMPNKFYNLYAFRLCILLHLYWI